MLYGLDVTDKECNDKHFHQIFQRKNKTVPQGECFWRSKRQSYTFRNLTLTQILERPQVYIFLEPILIKFC